MKEKGKFCTADEYIALQPLSIKAGLDLLRKTIKTAAPDAEELISYQMPAYRLKGMLAFFSATKKHYGFYPTGIRTACYSNFLKKGASSLARIS